MKNIKPKIYLLSFLISAGVTAVIYAAGLIWPFGGHCVLTGDLDRQFVAFYHFYRSIFTSNQDLLYTFSKTIGGDMPGFASYYLNNPLLFILLFFPEEKIAVGMEVLILVQTALCGLSASVLLNNMNKPSYSSLIFSTAYSGMGFVSAYLVVTLYFTNIALLPIVILAFFKYLDENRGRVWFILLTAMYVFMNYYLGYMLMLFMAILYISRVIKDTGYIKKLPALIFSIATALCLNGVMLLTTVFSLQGEKSSLTADFAFYRRFRLTDFLSLFLAGNDSASQLPMIYCSIIAVFFGIIWFTLKHPIREKLSVLFILGVLYVSMWINTIDSVWHGFNNPQGFPFRYSFYFSGTIIYTAYRGYLEITEKREEGRAGLLLSFAMVFILPVILYITGNPYVGIKRLAVNEAFICIAALSVFLSRRKGKVKAAYALCLAALIIEVSYSSALTYPAFNSTAEDGSLPLLSDFYERYKAIKAPVDSCRPEGDEIYRIEKDFYYSPNDPMLFDYAGLSHYSSCEKAEVRHFMERMGLRDTGVYAFYNRGSTAFTDILLGVRYYISRFDETYKPYSYVSKVGDYHVYENPYALGIAFSADEKIRDTDMEKDNIFECQNNISKLTGDPENGDIYLKADHEREDTPDGLKYTVHVTEKLPLYFYFDTVDSDPVEIYVNGTDWGHYFTDTDKGVLNAGIYDPGTKIEIMLKPLGEHISVSEEEFYFEDTGAIKTWYESIPDTDQKSAVHLKESSKLSFDMTIPENSVYVMSIPYDSGWKIKIDGKKAVPEKVLGALLAFPAEKGAHHIEMRYIPRGSIPGLIITLVGIIMLVLSGLSLKNCRRSNPSRE